MQRFFAPTLVVFYSIIAFLLLLYSYTQIDLSLTLSQSGIIQTIQKHFQAIGFYNRPLSTAIFLILVTLLFVLYGISIYLAYKNKISKKQVWLIVGIISTLLLFSYSAAFSYDIFNYIFTSKTVLLYRQNPYLIKPLDFLGVDPMLSYMRWTHLPSAYTPLWILLSLPAYIFSLGSILLNIWLLKATAIIFYFLTIWSLIKIEEKTKENSRVTAVFFALNPVVIIEVLVGGHNDIVMMGLALLSFMLWQQKKLISSFLALSLSVATKFMTIFLIPLSLIGWSKRFSLWLMLFGLGLVLLRREFLPWYFLWTLPFIALNWKNLFVFIISFGVSIALVLRYAPILYNGSYSDYVTQITNYIVEIPILVSGIIAVGFWILNRRSIFNKTIKGS